MNRIEDRLQDADRIPTTLDWVDVLSRDPQGIPPPRRRVAPTLVGLAIAVVGIAVVTWAFFGDRGRPTGPTPLGQPQHVAGARCLSRNEPGLITCRAAVAAARGSGDAPKVAGTVEARLGRAKVSEHGSVRAWVLTYPEVPTLPAPEAPCELRGWIVRVNAVSGAVYFDGEPSGPPSPCPTTYSHPWALPRVVAATSHQLSLEWPRGFDVVTFDASTCRVSSRSLIFQGGASGGGGCQGGIYLLTSGSGGFGENGIQYWTLGGKTLPTGVTVKVTLRSSEVLTPSVHNGLWLVIRAAPAPKEPGIQTSPFLKVQAVNSSGRVIATVKLG